MFITPLPFQKIYGIGNAFDTRIGRPGILFEKNEKLTDFLSLDGYCGSSDAHCGTGCQSAYGTGCQGISTTESFANALKYGQADEVAGGQWYWDGEAELFWTFDTAALIQRKFEEIVEAKGLGGVFAWSLGEDSYNWSHITAITQGVKAL